MLKKINLITIIFASLCFLFISDAKADNWYIEKIKIIYFAPDATRFTENTQRNINILQNSFPIEYIRAIREIIKNLPGYSDKTKLEIFIDTGLSLPAAKLFDDKAKKMNCPCDFSERVKNVLIDIRNLTEPRKSAYQSQRLPLHNPKNIYYTWYISRTDIIYHVPQYMKNTNNHQKTKDLENNLHINPNIHKIIACLPGVIPCEPAVIGFSTDKNQNCRCGEFEKAVLLGRETATHFHNSPEERVYLTKSCRCISSPQDLQPNIFLSNKQCRKKPERIRRQRDDDIQFLSNKSHKKRTEKVTPNGKSCKKKSKKTTTKSNATCKKPCKKPTKKQVEPTAEKQVTAGEKTTNKNNSKTNKNPTKKIIDKPIKRKHNQTIKGHRL